MSTTASKTQLTSLFDNRTLSRLERMRLNPHRRLTNRSRGEHLSGKGGSSTDFVDYRNYVPGDDMRYVDWNIFARLNCAEKQKVGGLNRVGLPYVLQLRWL